MKYFDAHCHILSDENIPSDISLITNASQISHWQTIVELTRAHKNIYGAIGVHPWYVKDLPMDWLARLRATLISAPDMMVGEIGLDRTRPDFDIQTDVFVRQLEIACDIARGVHIHCTGAWNDMLRILNRYIKKLPPFILFHRYSGATTRIAELAHKYNAYFSYNTASNPRIAHTPENRLLLESDSATPTQIIALYKSFMAHHNTDINIFFNNATQMLSHVQTA